MKINSKLDRVSYTMSGDIEVTFIVNKFCNSTIQKLDKDETYVIDINKSKPKRSLDQNAYMWSVIHEIAEHRNGRANSDNEWDVYLEALEKSGAKYELITCIPEAEAMLKENFRSIKLIKEGEVDGRRFNAYKVFYGSSKMDSKEMTNLIEEVLDIASKEGINADYNVY